jgi:hypothetical protein
MLHCSKDYRISRKFVIFFLNNDYIASYHRLNFYEPPGVNTYTCWAPTEEVPKLPIVF